MVLDLRDKIMIEKLYLAGVDAKEISRRIGKSVDAIRKYIQRNLKDLKEKHEAEKERTREVLRKTKWECSQEISNSNFAKFNRSISPADTKSSSEFSFSRSPLQSPRQKEKSHELKISKLQGSETDEKGKSSDIFIEKPIPINKRKGLKSPLSFFSSKENK